MDEVAFGRYRLLELIGEGGMGQVFKAYDTVIGRDVAIKVLPPEMATLAGYQERFRREAQVAARLTEPHIIPIHDTGEIDGRLYLVMPIIEGIDVQTLLAREGPMTPPRAVRVIQQLAAALNVAHRNGLVHRDIKPSNALMTPDEHIYLIDFGIAHDASATRMTQTGMMVGTFSYMAPERFLAGTVDARADVYALTCVLHECLTGARPFPGDSMEQQIAGHLTMEPPKPSSFSPAIPAAFDPVIARGMAKQPNERYQTAGELATAAQDALNAVPAPPPPAPTQPLPRPQPVHTSPPRPRGPRAPMPVRLADPTLAATQQATTLVGTIPAPQAPTIGVGRFTCVLISVVLVALATAGLIGPWQDTSWSVDYDPVLSTLMWVVILGAIPGIVLLALGRGRARADMTMAGCALVALGLGTVLWRSTYAFGVSPLAFMLLAAVSLIPAFPRSTRALARGYLLCGTAILALAVIDLLLLRHFRTGYVTDLSLVIGAGIGVMLLMAGAIARRLAEGRPAEPPAAAPAPSAGRFGCVLCGVVLLAISVALLLVAWGGKLLAWLVLLGAVPGIVLLVLGRGRAHADQTITGCALVTLALNTLPLGLGLYPPYFASFYIGGLLAIVGLLLLLIPGFPRPTRALARGYLLCGAGILVLASIVSDIALAYLLAGAAAGLILVVAGAIAWSLARRNTQNALGAPQLPAAAAGR